MTRVITIVVDDQGFYPTSSDLELDVKTLMYELIQHINDKHPVLIATVVE